MNALHKYRFCFMAGLCAAGGSFFGKMPSFLKDKTLLLTDAMPDISTSVEIYAAFILFQLLPLGLMILSNLLNWRYFLKALQLSEQTLTATVLTAASNYIVTFILGFLVFKEPITWLSTLGSTFIVLGLWFLCDDRPKPNERNKDQ